MLRLLIPIILALIGTGGGVAAAMFLFPPEPEPDLAALGPCGPGLPTGHEMAADDGHGATEHEEVDDHGDVEPSANEYAKMNNQFVVPVVVEGRIGAMMLLSITIEVEAGQQEIVFAHEPRLRDEFLQVLFDHANVGGFEGAFTASSNMHNLRNALRAAGRDTVGAIVIDILITDIVRQEIRS
ncbi:MAG: flagellar basal body-associated FliL family protein [Rhodobacteraceae bacterium]|nr:flagellar basal body-associated FliL family protein [Paracoccaceae bacterium]